MAKSSTGTPGVTHGKFGQVGAAYLDAGGHPPHRCREGYQVGEAQLYLGAFANLDTEDLTDGFNLIVPLAQEWGRIIPFGAHVLWAALTDYGGVPDNWQEVLTKEIVPRLRKGQRLAAGCYGGHGRTGVFYGSLIALMEDETRTPDPIEAVWRRYCHRAVESDAQVRAVFRARGQLVPETYADLTRARAAFVASVGRS